MWLCNTTNKCLLITQLGKKKVIYVLLSLFSVFKNTSQLILNNKKKQLSFFFLNKSSFKFKANRSIKRRSCGCAATQKWLLRHFCFLSFQHWRGIIATTFVYAAEAVMLHMEMKSGWKHLWIVSRGSVSTDLLRTPEKEPRCRERRRDQQSCSTSPFHNFIAHWQPRHEMNSFLKNGIMICCALVFKL